MGFKCHVCSSGLINLSLLFNHWWRVHGQDPNFNIVCGLGGCGRTYQNFFGYRSHLQRHDNDLWRDAKNITELDGIHQSAGNDDSDESCSGELGADDIATSSDDEVEDGEEEDHEAIKNPLRCARAAYLLRIKETHNLTQAAVNDIVMNTKMLIQDAVEKTCETIVKKLQNNTGEDYSEQVSWDVIADENADIASPFQGMETENGQRQTYRELFGLVVSISVCEPFTFCKEKYIGKHESVLQRQLSWNSRLHGEKLD